MALGLWLIDRSGYEAGVQHCPRDRYLSRHAGPHGYGWQRRAQSVPIVTGTLVHDPITTIMRAVQEADAIPTEAVAQAAIDAAWARYDQIVEARGLAVVLDPDALTQRTMEQKLLLAGLTWTWYYVALPAWHAAWRVVSVEEEFVSVVGCTCGLGDEIGTADQHDDRNCAGVGWMTRADILAQRRASETYGYHEIKTTGAFGKNYDDQWYHKVQLLAGALGYERTHNVRIDEAYVHALLKGKYDASWNPDEGKASGPRFQNSPLCYAGRRAANPPLVAEDWTPRWSGQYYWDAVEQRRRKQGKDYLRTPITQLPDHWWAPNALSATHYWAQVLHQDGILAESYHEIGPIYRMGDGGDRVAQFLTQLVGEERRWQRTLWELWECAQTFGWETPEFQTRLDQLIPQARGAACQSYFGDRCDKLPLCDKTPGWETPEMLGFIPRRPHHAPELAQAIDRGLLAPEDGVADEDSDE